MANSGGQFTTTVYPEGFVEWKRGPTHDTAIVVTGLTVLGDYKIVSNLEQVELFGDSDVPDLTVLLSQLLRSRPWPTRIFIPARCAVSLSGSNLLAPVELVVSWKEQTF
jgi:hypothetical protein